MELEKANRYDQEDALSDLRQAFFIPKVDEEELVYLSGNSLGLQCRSTSEFVQAELDAWAKYGVEGHFTGAKPWVSYHEQFSVPLSRLTGAKPVEVVAMNSLTVNLHLALSSFYKPKGKKSKILIERSAFGSDIYAVKSQIKWHGLNPEEELLFLEEDSQQLLSTVHICDVIARSKEEIALVLLGGVNYLSGQCYEMEEIARCAHENDCFFGVDLAHAIGNVHVPLSLNKWGVDFAVWCSYKYLNSGPGGVGGLYIHENHHGQDLTRLEGWWGTQPKNRFKMGPDFDPIPTVEAWQLSNAPVLSMAALAASLALFDSVDLEALRAKSIRLTTMLFEGLSNNPKIKIITPQDFGQRGAQLSLFIPGTDESLIRELRNRGVVADWRSFSSGGILRMAPVPLYNSFSDVKYAVECLNDLVK